MSTVLCWMHVATDLAHNAIQAQIENNFGSFKGNFVEKLVMVHNDEKFMKSKNKEVIFLNGHIIHKRILVMN